MQECQKLYICEICGTGFSKELSLHFNTWEKKLIFQKVPTGEDSAEGGWMLSLLKIRSYTVLGLGFGLFFGFGGFF